MASYQPRRWGAAKRITDINLTPLLDVLLILIVMMLLLMTLFSKQLPVSLPVSDIEGVPLIEQSVQVSITPDGNLLYKNSAISSEELAHIVNSEVTIELSVDRSVTYDVMASRIAQLQKTQPKTISLVTR